LPPVVISIRAFSSALKSSRHLVYAAGGTYEATHTRSVSKGRRADNLASFDPVSQKPAGKIHGGIVLVQICLMGLGIIVIGLGIIVIGQRQHDIRLKESRQRTFALASNLAALSDCHLLTYDFPAREYVEIKEE
jgi:hypothetical protein